MVSLEPKAFDLLAYLVRHRDLVVSKDDLLQEVWGSRIVSEAALTTRINAVRRALGDDGTAQRMVRTFTRKGIRFIGDITELPDPAAPAAIRLTDPVPLPDKPSIAVLPFQNLSGDPEQDYFADGVVEEIITALSRIRWLFVIARNTSFTFKGQAIDIKRIGQELSVRYVLEGSVRGGERVRIAAQLIEGETGTHLWADRFDGLMEDVFELQDKIAISVAGVIEPALQAAETCAAAPADSQSHRLRSLPARPCGLLSNNEGGGIHQALELLDQAIVIDPRYGPALSWAANCHMRIVVRRLDRRKPETSHRKASDFARQALQVVKDDPGILANAAQALARFWRGYRCHDRADRSCAGAQPGLCPWLGYKRRSQEPGRPARSCDRTS